MKTQTPSPMITLYEQVVSVTAIGNTNKSYFADGVDILDNARFCNVAPETEDQNRIKGTAPNDGSECFVLMEYTPNGQMQNFPFKLYKIDRETRTDIDVGRIMFAPETNGEFRTFSGRGDKIHIWEIVTQKASPELIEKANLFNGGKTRIKRSTINIEPITEIMSLRGEDLRGTEEPVKRLFNKCTLFADFVREHCNNDTTVTVVSDCLIEYLEKNKIFPMVFAKKIDVASPVLITNLVALNKLHPDLRPMLNVSRIESEREGKPRMKIDIGAILSRFPKDQQLAVWSEVKDISCSQFITTKLRYMLRKKKTVS